MKRIEFEDALVVEPAKVSILDEMPVGSIVQYGGTNAPAGWLICDGSSISRTEYKDLFNAINTSYGVGDGSTTFNLPNLKGRVAVGLDSDDTDFNTIGKLGGEKKHTLTVDEMPSHGHITGGAGGERVGLTGTTWNHQSYNPDANIATNYVGGNKAHNNLQPYAVINYIIKAVQNTRDFNITDAVTDGGTDLNKETFNGMQDNIENAIDEKNDKLESGVILSNEMSEYTIGTQTKRFYNLSFKKTYNKPPIVVVSYYNDKPLTYGDIIVSVGNITTTGCRLNFGLDISNSVLGISYVVIPIN